MYIHLMYKHINSKYLKRFQKLLKLRSLILQKEVLEIIHQQNSHHSKAT
jgi:hypothetical protein